MQDHYSRSEEMKRKKGTMHCSFSMRLLLSMLSVVALLDLSATATNTTSQHLRSNPSATTRPTINRGGQAKNFRTCDGIPKHPIVGRDGSIQLLFREGVIQSIPTSLCGSKRGKNVILVIGDGMGWEMVRAGAIGKRVVDELTRLGCNVRNGCPNNQRARDAFAGRTLADYYTEGPGKGLSFQDLPNFTLQTTGAPLVQEPEPGNHYASDFSLLRSATNTHESRMAPLALDQCGFPIDFSPLDHETAGGNMILWDDVKGGKYPWDPRYHQANPDTSDGFDPTYIMQHAADSANTATAMATGHKASSGMISQNLYEEDVPTIIEEAMLCDKAGGVVTTVPMLHATPAAFVTHTNSRGNRNELQRGFLNVNPTMASGVCARELYPSRFLDKYRCGSLFQRLNVFNHGKGRCGALSRQWTVLTQDSKVKAENFYRPIANLDPDNGDHLMVCLGGDFTTPPRNALERDRTSLPLRGIDSSYHSRWCHRASIDRDPITGLPIGVTPNSVTCDHYSEEERKQIPHISQNVKAALDFLGKDDDGFFLMYEQGDIDWAAHANHMDDMLGTMLDIDDSVAVIINWINANGGWAKNALYVTADHDHYLTLDNHFPEALALLLIEGESYRITPERNSEMNPWSLGTAAGRHNDRSRSQIKHIRDFTTWTPDDIEQVAHFWGARGSGGNGWGSHSTRPVPVYYGGDDGCIKALEGAGFLVLGRQVRGVPGKIDQVHLHACMMKNLFGLS